MSEPFSSCPGVWSEVFADERFALDVSYDAEGAVVALMIRDKNVKEGQSQMVSWTVSHGFKYQGIVTYNEFGMGYTEEPNHAFPLKEFIERLEASDEIPENFKSAVSSKLSEFFAEGGKGNDVP